MKKQILVIHGGETFENYEDFLKFLREHPLELEDLKKGAGWKDNLQEDLGSNYEVLKPEMPNGWNAHYVEWAIWLEKIAPLLNPNVSLVGHSMGGNFLVKYLAENKFPKEIESLHLVAAPFDAEGSDFSMGDFALPSSLNLVPQQVGQIFIYQSTDDALVPPANADKYKKVFPDATLRTFDDREHFSQERFPEIVEDIKKIS
ncbi:MAG: alpha/beta hydrolase [Patescibacteria group bacterium]|nr:alpha/beta hydrolase [Patescibacteria group bacterium]